MFPRLLLLLALSALSAVSAELTIVRTFTGWRDGASFKRISEYFSGKENTGKETILRTHPEQRTGYYFLVRLANLGPAQKVQFQLQLFGEGAAAPRTILFPAGLKPGSDVFQLGLTGPEWQDPKSHPVAWQMQILTHDGRVLVAEKSYLWENSTGK